MTLLSSDSAFSGRVFSITRDRVQLPHGPEVTMDVVRHPGSVVLLPLAADDSLTLVRQYRHAAGQAMWEIPAGTIDDGETPEAAARRECHEEVGLWPDGAELLASLYPSPGYTTEVMHFYRLTGLREPDSPATPDAEEHLQIRTITLDALGSLIAAGEVVDMKTVVGWQLLTMRSKGQNR